MQTHTFHDFDAFATSVHGVESRMMQRNVKRRFWSLSSVDLNGVGLQVGSLGSGNIAEGQMRPDGCIIYLPLSDSVMYSANGEILGKDSLAILEPGSEFCFSTKVEHDWCGVFIPTQLFASGGPSRSLSASEAASVRVIHTNHQTVSRLRDIAGQIISVATECPNFESSPAASRAAGELMNAARLAIGQLQAGISDPVGRPKVSRQDIIARSMDLLAGRNDKCTVAGDLATAAGVSERTLRYAFNEYYGVGPVRYLQLRQLHQMRHVLKAGEPEQTTISNILAQHGIWEFSRFASRYRRLFGELPSETLRTKKR